MSSAGVYMASEEMPHVEIDPTDTQSCHVGKLESEQKLRSLGLRLDGLFASFWTAFDWVGEQFTTGQVYNIQNTQAIAFDGVTKAAAKAAGVDPLNVKIVHYNPEFYMFPK
eukprot:12535969-Ditylum_brightwellii.AAC.1